MKASSIIDEAFSAYRLLFSWIILHFYKNPIEYVRARQIYEYT